MVLRASGKIGFTECVFLVKLRHYYYYFYKLGLFSDHFLQFMQLFFREKCREAKKVTTFSNKENSW